MKPISFLRLSLIAVFLGGIMSLNSESTNYNPVSVLLLENIEAEASFWDEVCNFFGKPNYYKWQEKTQDGKRTKRNHLEGTQSEVALQFLSIKCSHPDAKIENTFKENENTVIVYYSYEVTYLEHWFTQVNSDNATKYTCHQDDTKMHEKKANEGCSDSFDSENVVWKIYQGGGQAS